MSIVGSYSICNTSFQVECEDNRLAKRIIVAIDDYLLTIKNGSISNSHSITLRFKNNDFSIKVPTTAQELSTSSSLRVLKSGDFCYLTSGDSIVQLDLKNSIGTGSLDSNFWRSCLKCKQDFLMLSILWLLRPHGLYALHANGVVRDDVGVLIAGDSGSGKSTLALTLIRQGWGYLSDDVTLIRKSPDGIEAIAFLKGFSFDLSLASRYPELNSPLEVSHRNGQKKFLDIRSLYPDRFLSDCFPKVLIFPTIVSQHKSSLIPIDETKALILLAENSGGIMVDKEMVVRQLEVLKGLVYQTTNYELLAGRDLYEEPEKIVEILSEVI